MECARRHPFLGWPASPSQGITEGAFQVSRRLLILLLSLLTLLAVASPTVAQETADRFSDRAAPDSVADLMLNTPIEASSDAGVLDASLAGADGDARVIVRLQSPSVSETKAKGRAARNAKKTIETEQSDLLDRIAALDPSMRILAEIQVVMNAVLIEVDAATLGSIAEDPAVQRVAPVGDYELDLSETVPYIGAAAVQAAGYDGTGVRVAVLDSGIDYTHANLGGGGTLADYEAAYGTSPSDLRNTTRDGLFPTAKVVDGYDFVGEAWVSSISGPALAPDPDPIDFEGHGTHVADIIGGSGGVAPGVDLYAVKVCSALSTACSGVALIQGMEFAVDPDGNGDPADAVDIINMSLGSDYGQAFDDDLSQAVENAATLGVLTVASAGNGADKPFVAGTPSVTPAALSVAETHVPSATLQLLEVDGVDYPGVFQPWSVPLSGVISGPVQYGDGAGGNRNGCAPFAPGSLTGLIVLVDRGACNFTLKISNISQAGGLAGLIGLVAPGAPFSGGDGGDRPIDIPGYMISQADSNAIKASIGNPGTGTFDPANQLPLIGQMVGSSSRGPASNSHIIKPEIGAPGASISAIAGSGTGTGPFGGTSGAAPMVAGSAALLLQAEPALSPPEVKARLVNTGETNIDTDPFRGLAPITRLGGGEVRVDAAVDTPLAAWDADTLLPTLSFGHIDVAQNQVKLKKTLFVQNYSDSRMMLDVTPTFRYQDDVDSGAVAVTVSPGSVNLQAGASRNIEVELTITGANLPGNFMNSGSQGANGDALTANEFDGYVVLEGGGESVHVPWQVLPRQAARVVPAPNSQLVFRGGDVAEVKLDNKGVGIAQNDAYSLIAVSPNQPEGGPGALSPTPDIRAVGVNTFPVPAGFCSGQESFIWAFAVNTWERQSHLVPVSHQVILDVDQDGTDDYVVLNRDVSGPTTISDGRQVTWVLDLGTGGLSAFFFAEHSTVTGNTVLYICAEQVGLTGTDMLSTNVDATVYAQDFYFGGPGDVVAGLTITPLGERYVATSIEDVPGNAKGTMVVTDFGAFPGNTPELGVMLVTNGDRGFGASGGATQDTEAVLLLAR